MGFHAIAQDAADIGDKAGEGQEHADRAQQRFEGSQINHDGAFISV